MEEKRRNGKARLHCAPPVLHYRKDVRRGVYVGALVGARELEAARPERTAASVGTTEAAAVDVVEATVGHRAERVDALVEALEWQIDGCPHQRGEIVAVEVQVIKPMSVQTL